MCPNAPYSVNLLCLTPDNFTRQGEWVGYEWVTGRKIMAGQWPINVWPECRVVRWNSYLARLWAAPPFRVFRFPCMRKERRDCRQHIKKRNMCCPHNAKFPLVEIDRKMGVFRFLMCCRWSLLSPEGLLAVYTLPVILTSHNHFL